MKPKRLTRLKISEVSAVPHGAGEGVRIILAKRVTGFDDTGELLINGVPRWRLKSGVTKVDRSDSLAKALDEIEINKRAAGDAAAMEDRHMQTDVIKTMDDRLAEIRKADPSIRSDQQAMLKLAQSRNLDDQTLWREFKDTTVPVWAIGKAVDAGQAVAKMAKRVDEIMAADPSVRSRESGIAKVAMSTLPSDQAIWRDYRAGTQGTSESALPHSDVAAVGKSTESLAFLNLCGALSASYPHLSVEQVRQWARAIQAKAPPAAALTQRTPDAA